jgi:ribosomal protein S8
MGVQNHLANLIAQLNVASWKNVKSVKIKYTALNLRLIILFQAEGYLEGLKIFGNYIIVFLKYAHAFLLFRNVKLISKPGKRVYWKLIQLRKKYAHFNFSGTVIISSHKGLICSHDALLKLRTGGEVFLKIGV